MRGARRPHPRSLVVVALLCSALVGAVLAGTVLVGGVLAGPLVSPVVSVAAGPEGPAIGRQSRGSELAVGLTMTPAKRAKAEGDVLGMPARVVPPLGTLAALVVVWLAVGRADPRPPRGTSRRAIGSRDPPSSFAAA